jgi:hypothetical protein
MFLGGASDSRLGWGAGWRQQAEAQQSLIDTSQHGSAPLAEQIPTAGRPRGKATMVNSAIKRRIQILYVVRFIRRTAKTKPRLK